MNKLCALTATLAAVPNLVLAAEADTITFSEFPLGTRITTQHSDRGIVFGGDDPFITTDGANPTSPVLSGFPLFVGAIAGTFVDPIDGITPTVVPRFSLDAGYFDEFGSTRIEWFDPEGRKLGQRTNRQFGIENFVIEGGNIASWRIGILENEPAGYAIDNVTITPMEAAVLFREVRDTDKEGTWGFLGDEIPGFDHVGFLLDDLVYESHPGYALSEGGTFVSADGSEAVRVDYIFGVQAQHTEATFAHDSMSADSPVIDFEEIPIARELAERMAIHIDGQIANGAQFQYIEVDSWNGIQRTLSPAAQKGGDNSFTCVGLVEWAAEQAGHNDGQGFILNQFESAGSVPFLSPMLLNFSMKAGGRLQAARQWFQGLFDPVDFVVVDPLGRRLGFVVGRGRADEIPGAFYSGDGEIEQFLIPNAVPGIYRIELIGLGQQVAGGIASKTNGRTVDKNLAIGVTDVIEMQVEVVANALGDVNGDGVINLENS